MTRENSRDTMSAVEVRSLVATGTLIQVETTTRRGRPQQRKVSLGGTEYLDLLCII